MHKTNRTEQIGSKVSPEIKAEIIRKNKLGWNFAEWLEMAFKKDFMVKQSIEDNVKWLQDKLKESHDALDRIKVKEEDEKRLSLDAREIHCLRQAAEFSTLRKQHECFISLSGRNDLNFKEFVKIRNKYIQ